MTQMNNIKRIGRNFKVSIFASAILLTLFLVSCSGSKYTLNDYDMSGNGKLDINEFSTALDHTAGGTGAFNLADANSNGAVSEDEWNQYLGLVGFYTKYNADDRGSFKKWDTNNNGWLSEKELYDGIFQTVDNGANGSIPQNIANDGFIESIEWNQWYDNDLF